MFYHIGQTSLYVQWRNREKRNYKEHHEKASFFHLAQFQYGSFCFVFEKTSSPPPTQFALLFVHVEKRSNCDIRGKTLRSSRSQMFFKVGVLKNFAILPRRYLRWSLFLIKLIKTFLLKKRYHQHRYFLLSIAKLLRTFF